MIAKSQTIRRFILNFPGYKTFGLLAFLPVYFVCGAALEYVMINWTVGETNFYKTFKRTQSQAEAKRRLQLLLAEARQDQAAQ